MSARHLGWRSTSVPRRTFHDATLRLQRGLVLAVVLFTPVVFWRPLGDVFELPKVAVALVGVVAVLATGALRATAAGRIAVPAGRVAVALGSFVVALGVATATSQDVVRSVLGSYERWSGLLMYGGSAALALVVLRITNEAFARGLLRTILVAGTLVGGYAVVQGVGVDPLGWTNPNLAAFSTMGNPNFLSAYLGLVVAAATWQVADIAAGAAWRCLGLAVAVLALLGLGAAGSLQGWVVAAGGSGLVGSVTAWRWSGRVRRLAASTRVRAGLLTSGVLGVGALGVTVLPRAPDLLGYSLRLRLQLWDAAVGMFADHPWLGVGLDTYSHTFGRYQPAAYDLPGSDAAHSVPLQLLTGGGLVLGVAYGAVVAATGWALVRGLRRSTGRRRGLLAGLGGVWLGWQLQSLISIDVPPLLVLHFVVAGALAGLALGPQARVVRVPLPGARTGGSERARTAALTVVGVLAAAAVAATAVGASRPLRADHAAFRGWELGPGPDETVDVHQAQASLAAFEASHRLAPWEGGYWHDHGLVLERLDRPREALGAYLRATELMEGRPEPGMDAARLARELGREELAARTYDSLVRRFPVQPYVLSTAAQFYADTGREDRARRLATRAPPN